MSDGEDARKIADAVLQDPGLASKLYDAFSVYQKGSNRESILPPKATPAFMKSPVWLDTDRGERKTRKKILKSWERFLTGMV